jgi:hypothetical protein
VIVFLVGGLAYTATFLIWLFVVVGRRRRGESVPELMYAFTVGSLIFSVICVVLLVNYQAGADAMRWLFSLGGVGFLLLTIKKVKR